LDFARYRKSNPDETFDFGRFVCFEALLTKTLK
jgi:hypothetical protein